MSFKVRRGENIAICASSDYDKEKLYFAFKKSGIMDKIAALEKRKILLW